MAQIHGKIETLVSLRDELHSRGVRDFSSVKEINDFLKRYEQRKESIQLNAKIALEMELKALHQEERLLNKEYRQYKKDGSFFSFFKQNRSHRKLKSKQREISLISNNYEGHLLSVQVKAIRNLVYQKTVLEDLKPLIAGAVGERKVENELKKLPDHCHIFNNFVLRFDKALYYKPKGEYIQSIQIDHLVLTRAGLFIVETKNWSDKTLDNPNMYSPVNQVRRCSFALYIALQDKKVRGLSLTKKIWGVPKIPIRNIIALINRKPNLTFDHVKLKKVEELNSYINYFQPVFTVDEVARIAKQLRRMNEAL